MSLAIRGLTKRYGNVSVLDAVDLIVADGEIHALLGGNGAGKSTLIKCVSGAVVPDAGEILLNGRRHLAMTPRGAMKNGVAVVYQDLSVVDTLSVADNVFLGDERRAGPFVMSRRTLEETRLWLARLGSDLDPREMVGSLSSAERQIVEIVKALRREPAVLILDEPTAALTEAEQHRLAASMTAARRGGHAILFVTHRLAEVFEVADRVTVLRGGRVVMTAAVRDTCQEELVRAIAGRDLDRQDRARAAAPSDGPCSLKVRGLVAPGIGPIDLELPRGQVLGVFGLVGSGRTELLEAIFGIAKGRRGRIDVDGRPVAASAPAEAIAAGLALVPSDRLRRGIVATMRADDNLLLPKFGPLSRLRFWRNPDAEGVVIRSAFRMLRVTPNTPALEARRFSGGNQQKLVVGRWLTHDTGCRVILLDEPTSGVDVGGRADLYDAILTFATRGGAVIVTSSEPDELLQIADRIVVLGRGRVTAVMDRAAASEDVLIAAAHAGEQGEPRHG